MSTSAAALWPSYGRRRPELTALHIVVREHLETFLLSEQRLLQVTIMNI